MTTPYKHKLSNKDLRHLKDNGMVTMYLIENTLKTQAENRKESEIEPCFECKTIARKLGLPI